MLKGEGSEKHYKNIKRIQAIFRKFGVGAKLKGVFTRTERESSEKK